MTPIIIIIIVLFFIIMALVLYYDLKKYLLQIKVLFFKTFHKSSTTFFNTDNRECFTQSAY